MTEILLIRRETPNNQSCNLLSLPFLSPRQRQMVLILYESNLWWPSDVSPIIFFKICGFILLLSTSVRPNLIWKGHPLTQTFNRLFCWCSMLREPKDIYYTCRHYYNNIIHIVIKEHIHEYIMETEAFWGLKRVQG